LPSPERIALGRRVLLGILFALATIAPARAATPDCVPAQLVLWGDGRHDDTVALGAWLQGKDAVWASSGEPVGAAITGHSFRLSSAVYVTAGTGRRLDDFRLLWPERGETVSGGTIATGNDPEKPPALVGVDVVGGDADEGQPFEAPDPPRVGAPQNCATS